MKCLDCGFENKEGNKFCEGCGANLEIPKMPKFCIGCGKEIVPGNKFCVGCGKPIQPVGNQVSMTEEMVQLSIHEEKSKKKMPIVSILIGVLLAGLLIAGALWVISNRDTDNDRNNDDNTQKNATQIEEQEEIPETESYIEETQAEETEKEPEEVILGASDYQTICMELMETESVYGSVNEKMAVDMAQMIVSADIVFAGDSYCMKDISSANQDSLMYELGYPSGLYDVTGIHYNLQDYREEFEGTEYDLSGIASVYKKDDFIKVAEAFCAYAAPSYGSSDFGDYIGFLGADGGPWYYFDAYDIKEKDKYIMVKAACYTGNNGGAENVYTYTAKILFEKTTDSVLGMRAVYVEGYSNQITQNVASITASSQLPDYKEKTYKAENMIDGDYGTPWVENVDGVGVGETIQITLNSKTWVQEFILYNGYQLSQELCDMNGYVTKISVDFGNGIVREIDYSGGYYGDDKDYFSLNKVSLDRPVYTDSIKITILDAKAGSKFSDTCISEIELH